MVIDSVSDEASLLLPLLENQYDDILSSQNELRCVYVYVDIQCTRAKLVAYTLIVYIPHHNLSRIKSNKCFEKFRIFSI